MLSERIAEHSRDVRNRRELSHVYDHTRKENGHSFDFGNVEVIDRESNKFVRKRLEGIYTHTEDNPLNKAWEINPIYHSLF